jgi:hypothetical protein
VKGWPETDSALCLPDSPRGADIGQWFV